MKRLLIGSPIRQKPPVLRYFLSSLERLSVVDHHIDYYFIDDNDVEESSAILNEFITKQQEANGSMSLLKKGELLTVYTRNEHTHYWSNELIDKIASWKDDIITTARDQGYDGLFLIDSDLLMHPAALQSLILAEKDIISTIFWTQWQPGTMELPQVWLKDTYWPFQSDRTMTAGEDADAAIQLVMKLRIPGIYEVGGLGACTYISRTGLEKDISFRKIPNLSFWGEDRHFCVRAAALGLSLHVDTKYPAFHIYRDSDLIRADLFMESTAQSLPKEAAVNKTGAPFIIVPGAAPKLTLSMIVKNEGDRYLRDVLQHHREYIDHAVIIDDGSTDHTGEIVHEYLAGIPLTYIKNDESKFHNEVQLRMQQWEETIRTRPQWILNMDADEYFEDKFNSELPQLLQDQTAYVYLFRLYDFWSEDQYREDSFWNAHSVYRPFLLKYAEGYPYEWKQTPQHCGRFPQNIYSVTPKTSSMRVKHFGWAREKDRIHKYERYKQLDPDAIYGWKEQYESILDAAPNLIKWIE
ncbi:hypothetical protein FHS15_001840 [Paenibacillus castaneae]|uniref:glycosyltransferase n=1 Tax=Paenibacillus castaneae TaxID=474957 RepID=UPI001ABA9B4F|nr:glycosyltransferase [Paenibacillus castaneae]NIK76715.1 hypothetical protein [Paenibacillus castaneae]